MALEKRNLNLNFAQGVDTKADPFEVAFGKFESLWNSIFTQSGLLSKRPGYAALSSLPSFSADLLTTFNGGLTAIGSQLEAYSSGYGQWVNRGFIRPVSLSTMPLIRASVNCVQADSAVASNGLVCTAYALSNNGTDTYWYTVADSSTGQTVIAPTQISTADASYGFPHVYVLGSYFIVLFTAKPGASYNLNYIAISISNPTLVTNPATISTSYDPTIGNPGETFEAAAYNGNLYIAWNGAASSGIKISYLTSTLSQASVLNPDAARTGQIISVTVDPTSSTNSGAVWVSYWSAAAGAIYAFALAGGYSAGASPVRSPTLVYSTGATLTNITSVASSNVATIFFEEANTYGYDGLVNTNLILSNTITQSGTAGTASTLLRSVGLGSKAVLVNGTAYFLVSYSSSYQPTYFLADSLGHILAKLAYQNGRGYFLNGLPGITVSGTQLQVSYLYRDLIAASTTTGNTSTPNVYSQLGVNLATFNLSDSPVTAEIGTNLHVTGGFLWSYDGTSVFENGFFLYPDNVELTPTTGGAMALQTYYYQVCYEWTDGQGNLYRSAPSIPVSVTLSGSNTSVQVYVPKLRLTYKTSSPVRIVIYRWSTAQQTYYQVTSLIAPVLNNSGSFADYVLYTDTLADASISGNTILYTAGGVVEDVGGSAATACTKFDSRLWLINAEDPNLLWFSKQVIEGTPVEMSDLFTMYVDPTLGSEGSTGPMAAIAAMDDKLIIFKENAIYYINGTGPDNTGSNSQYSQPIFVPSTVGCSNPQSVVLIPDGLMFQSDKGIWLLGRDLGTRYIGAPVEAYNSATVLSAVSVPGTNYVLFTLSTGVALMYDYYVDQWGTFLNVPAISSTLYQGLHTYLNASGQVFQATPGSYLDGASPVLMGFTTAWFNLAGLQGYQRAYFFFLMGTYLSPHKLSMQVAYDYNPVPTQSFLIAPNNYSGTFGSSTPFGSQSPFGGNTPLEQWRCFFRQQKCQAFQITMNEIFDASYGVAPGAGVTLSGLNLVFGVKKGYPRIPTAQSTG